MESLPCDVLNLILDNTSKDVNLVCKQYNTIYKTRNMEALHFYIDQIIKGNHKILSFEVIYRTIYELCLKKRGMDVIFLIRRTCQGYRNCYKWFEIIRIAKLIEDVCLYLTKNVIKRLRYPSIWTIVLRDLFPLRRFGQKKRRNAGKKDERLQKARQKQKEQKAGN